MIKIYGTKTCPDCAYICEQIKGNTDNYDGKISLVPEDADLNSRPEEM